ncbi:MAG: amidohydrolase family protein [Acutalibacteraceae bacterium]
MSIIDFRVRPIFKHYESFQKENIDRFLKAFGYEESDSLKQRNVESLIKELDEAGVVKSVVPGRGLYGPDINNTLLELEALYPDKFIIFPFLDVTNPEQALKDIDTYIINGKRKGASIEPYLGNDLKFDDERIFPIYQKLEENNIPVMATVSGWVGRIIDNTIPAQVARVLTAFPNLKFIAAHGGWPWFNEMVAITFKFPNLYLTADFEGTRGAGADMLRHGALYMASNQVIYASSYPYAPIAQSIQSVRDWKLPAEIEQKVLYDNAAKILGID